MTTAIELVTRSLRLISVLGTGRRTPTANEVSDGMVALNAMMGSLSIEGGLIFHEKSESYTLSVGVNSFTIGVSGDWNTARPEKILTAFIRDSSGYDYKLEVINYTARDSITLKTISARPQYLYYKKDFPLGVIELYYVPTATDNLHIRSWEALQSFATPTTELSMPPGYEDMIVYNLAIRLHGEYPGSILAKETMVIAGQTLSAVKRLNADAPMLDPSDSQTSGFKRGGTNIFTG